MKICAGIVLYEPESQRLKENVEAIISQVDKVFLIDNGSKNIDEIKKLFDFENKITFILNEENEGIAKALNQLCNTALKEDFDYIVTLDQDSVAGENMVEEMHHYIQEDIGVIAPRVMDDYEEQINEDLPLIEEIERPVTSGCITSLKVWEELGGFDEKMFIDCVDFDFDTRVLKAQKRIIRVNRAVLHHRLGKAKEVKFFVFFGKLLGIEKLKKPFYTYNHSVIRTYYYARNIKYYIFKHKDFLDLKTERRTYLKWFILKVFFEKQKLKKLFAIIKGNAHSKKLIREYKNHCG